MTQQDYLHSVYFKKLRVQYRVLNRGYLGNSAARMLRAVFKGIIQSQSPCVYQKDMECPACPRKETCCYFLLMEEDAGKYYLPYVIHTHDPGEWRGAFEPGEVRSFELCLLGEKAYLAELVVRIMKRKPLMSLNGPAGQRVRFELESVEQSEGGKTFRVNDLLAQYGSKGVSYENEIRHLTVEFVTPLDFTFGSKTVTEPEKMTFELFQKALWRRISELARGHCGFRGEIPRLETLLSRDKEIKTTRANAFRTVNPKAIKRDRHGREEIEYIGGLKDQLSFEGNLTPYFPLIVLGEALHIGNKTTQGLGKYKVVEINHRTL